jgi:hypothetical protein
LISNLATSIDRILSKTKNDGGYILIGHTESLNGAEGDILLIKTDSEGLVKRYDEN